MVPLLQKKADNKKENADKLQSNCCKISHQWLDLLSHAAQNKHITM